MRVRRLPAQRRSLRCEWDDIDMGVLLLDVPARGSSGVLTGVLIFMSFRITIDRDVFFMLFHPRTRDLGNAVRHAHLAPNPRT
jgi:hypothetical protein